MSVPGLPLSTVAPGRVVVAAAALGAAVALVVLTVTAPAAGPATALPDAGPAVALLSSGARLAGRVCAVVAVGGLLLPAWLLGEVRAPARVLRTVRVAAWAWVVASAVGMVATAAEALAVPLPGALASARVWAFVPTLETGRALMVTAVLAAFVGGGTLLVRTSGEALALLALALLAVLPTSLTGHVATSELHVPVTVGTAVHVVGALLWVGGLVGLGLLGRGPSLADAVGRFSGLALVAVSLVTVSGLLSAWWRLGPVGDAWRTSYGVLVLTKVALLAVLLALGAAHRRWSLPALRRGSTRVWWRLAAAETAVMGLALGAAVALGRAPTPTRPDVVALPHGGVTTVDRALPEPTAWRLVVEPRGSATGVVAVALLVLLVGLAASRPGLAPRAVWRGLAYGLGAAAVLGWLLLGGPGAYASALLVVHGLRLVAAALLVPPLLVLAAQHLLPAVPVDRRASPVDAALPVVVLVGVVLGSPLLGVSLARESVGTALVAGAVLAGLPAALLATRTDRRQAALVLVGVGLLVLLALTARPDAFAAQWFADLPLDWADPLRGTGIGERGE
ncbi:copper resistance D family protein [Phycicoccus sonneratiae]|uniref:CopD family protein n=1 Tax=Phycicoccus sonneratiae TaxID=2807628 RepID=A0ABS2CGC2_9MICO|nr:CopD family protein [Phycicoccus sonneraticus]MBM6398927.1 CopD family protein [Phycicoccus sonneraticus]